MKKIIIVAVLLVSTLSFSQKKTTTNAALKWGKYIENTNSGKTELAASELVEALEYINEASVHELTKTDAKTLMYKGMIYCEAVKVGKTSENKTLKSFSTPENLTKGLKAFKSSAANDPKGRYEDKIADYCSMQKRTSYNTGIKSFQAENYKGASDAFVNSVSFAESMGSHDAMDSAAVYYGGLSAFKAKEYETAVSLFNKSIGIGFEVGTSASYLSESLGKLDRTAEAETKLSEILKANPGNKDVMIALINIYLGAGKKVEAEKVLADAIALDPSNKELHYVVGTIYEGQERYEEAEKAYKKVLALDPNHSNALLGLGAVYFNKAANLNADINDLGMGDPKEELLRSEMVENFKNALPYLEKANELNPNNKEILNSLRQAYYKTGNEEKAMELKKKMDAIK